MTSENQNDFFNWTPSSTIDSGTLHRISIDDLVAQQQDQNEDSPQQQQDLADHIQNLNNQLQSVTSQQNQLEENTTDGVGNMGNTEIIPVSSSSSQLILPAGIVNPDAILPTNRTYTCRICQVTFPNKSAVTVHSRLHTNHEGKPFRCNFCNKGFSTNFYLKQHERIHNGQKPYKCPMCERSFKQLSHVQQHVRTHTGVRPYKCHWPGCGKAFLQQSHLKSHVARHSPKPSNGLRPFKCHWPDCGKSFAQLNNLKSHIARHQPKKKKPSAEESQEEQQQITIQVKQVNEDGNAVEGNFAAIITPNLIGQAAAAANIMPDTTPDNSESETIRPFLCPGCSKLYVREATFKKHLEECKTKLQLSISATAAALGIEPPSLPTTNSMLQQQDNSGLSSFSNNSQEEKPAKKRKLSKTIRKSDQQQQQLLEQQLMTNLPIEVSLDNHDGQLVSDAHDLNDIQVKQEVITLHTDGAGNLIHQGNNNTMFKLPQILEGHGIIQNNQILYTGSSGNLVVTAPLNNSNDGLFTVSTSNHQNNIHVTSLDSTISDQLLTSSTSPISISSPSNTPVSMPISVSQVLSSTQGYTMPQNSATTVVTKMEDSDSDSIPGHSTINQAALRWQWDQPVRLNFP